MEKEEALLKASKILEDSKYYLFNKTIEPELFVIYWSPSLTPDPGEKYSLILEKASLEDLLRYIQGMPHERIIVDIVDFGAPETDITITEAKDVTTLIFLETFMILLSRPEEELFELRFFTRELDPRKRIPP